MLYFMGRSVIEDTIQNLGHCLGGKPPRRRENSVQLVRKFSSRQPFDDDRVVLLFCVTTPSTAPSTLPFPERKQIQYITHWAVLRCPPCYPAVIR